MDVTMPDGTVVTGVPEGTTKSQLMAKLSKAGISTPQEGPGFLERTKDTAVQGMSDAMSAVAGDSFSTQGDRLTSYTPHDRLARAGGAMAGAYGNIAADALVTAGKAVLPEAAQEAIGSGVEAVASSAPARAVGSALETAKKEHPYLYDQIASRTAIASLAVPGPKLPRSNAALIADIRLPGNPKVNRQKLVASLLEPDNMDGDGRIVTKGALKTKVYEPTPWEERMYSEVSAVKGVKPKGNFTDNVNIIEGAVEKMRVALDKRLRGKKATHVNHVLKQVDEAVDKMSKHPSMVGDAGTSASRIYDMFVTELQPFVQKGGAVDPADLLQARRNLDASLKKEMPKIFDPATGKAQQVATRELRERINKLVNDAVPEAHVAESLRKQSDLLSARDIMRPRSIAEANNSVTRFIDTLERTTGVKHPTTPLAQQATWTSPIVAAGTAALAILVAGKQALNGAQRAAVIKLLGTADNVINRGGKAAIDMRADRAVILGLLEEDKKRRQEESK